MLISWDQLLPARASQGMAACARAASDGKAGSGLRPMLLRGDPKPFGCFAELS